MAMTLKQNAERIESAALDIRAICEAIGDVKPTDHIEDYAPILARGLVDESIESSWSGSRQTAGGMAIKDGLAVMDKLKGKSIKVWQKCPVHDMALSGSTLVPADSVRYYNDLISGDSVYSFKMEASHKYLFCFDWEFTQEIFANVAFLAIYFGQGLPVAGFTGDGFMSGGYIKPRQRIGRSVSIATTAATATHRIIRVLSETQGAFIKGNISLQIVDLTELFSSGNEPTTPDGFAQYMGYASIADMPYIEYTAEPQILPFNATAIRSKGRNLWDEEWEVGYYATYGDGLDGSKRTASGYVRCKNLVPVKGGSTIYFKIPKQFIVGYYDANGRYLDLHAAVNSSRLVTIPDGASLMSFYYTAAEYANDVCFNYSDSRDGTYTPYMPPVETPFRLSDIKHNGQPLFPEGMRDAGSAHDEINEIRRVADKRIGKVDLGTMNWQERPDIGGGIFAARELNYRFIMNVPAVCSKYEYTGTVDGAIKVNSKADKTLSLYWQSATIATVVYVKDTAYTTAAAFKAAMQGVMLYYELADPIEVPLPEDFHLPYYAVQNGGTEELLTEQPSAPIDAEIAYRYDYAALATDNASLLLYANERTGNAYPDLGEVIKDLTK